METSAMIMAWAAVAAGFAGMGALILLVDGKKRIEAENASLRQQLEAVWEERRSFIAKTRGEIRREYMTKAAKMQKRGSDGRFAKGEA